MIALYRGVSPLSVAIRMFTRTDYSHAAWICGDGTCVEAWHPGGVRHRSDPYAGHTKGTLVDYYGVIGMDASRTCLAEWFMKDRVGEPYDLGGVLRFVSRRRAGNPTRWFCSELVASACAHAEVPLLNAQPHEIAPGHIAWSTEVYPLGMEVDETAWRSRVARELLGKKRSLKVES